jgi:hypothetical protein
MTKMGIIVGDGDIGGFLREHNKARPDRIYFASGVSNSQETRESEYQKEKDLLLSQDRDKRLVYFGSLSIFYSNGRYARHKREMEELVMNEFPKYTIVRLGNITWGKNPHTLINYLRARVAAGEPIELRDETRYVADSEEFLHWIDLIPDGFNCEINIPGKRMKVTEIFKDYVLDQPK